MIMVASRWYGLNRWGPASQSPRKIVVKKPCQRKNVPCRGKKTRFFCGNFTAIGFNLAFIMNDTLSFARRMSVILFAVATLNYGHYRLDYAGTAPTSLGLIRLGRDITRRASSGQMLECGDASDALRLGPPTQA